MVTSECQCRCIRRRCCNACRTNQDRYIRALWVIPKYRTTYSVIIEFAGETSQFNSIIFKKFFNYNFQPFYLFHFTFGITFIFNTNIFINTCNTRTRTV